MSETFQGPSIAAFTARRKNKFKSRAQTERKLHGEVCTRKLKAKQKGKKSACNRSHFKGGYKYAFRNGIHDSPGRSAGEPRRGLPGAGRSRCQHCRFSGEPGDARKEFGPYGD